ncbi:Cytochrome P450 67 [Colletotrichum chlorophyti]|uniref:Cytochrome P450 67 n=1 Tax=Colletotrichum chlorophyti TaxID=708187 RepID=A0A1Q8RJ31_9PEZI|nr:Cytochrome P450 67 [Colletotrichum chlorophyti]
MEYRLGLRFIDYISIELGSFLGHFSVEYQVSWRFITLGGEIFLGTFTFSMNNTLGDFVRYSPNQVSIRNSDVWEGNGRLCNSHIYGFHRNVSKFEGTYSPFRIARGFTSTWNTTDVDIHKSRRKLLNKCFSEQALDGYSDSITVHIDEFMRQMLEGLPADQNYMAGPINFAYKSDVVAREIITHLVSGKTWGFQNADTKTTKLLENIRKFERKLYMLGFAPWLKVFPSFKPSPALGQWIVQSSKQGFISESKNTLVAKMLAARDEDQGAGLSENDVIADARFFLLGGKISCRHLPFVVLVLIAAGSVTSSSALSAAVFFLLHHPTETQQLYTELRDAFPTYSDIKVNAQLMRCKRLKAVLEEAMRLAPPVPTLLPRLVGPGGIEAVGRHIPEGVVVGAPCWAISRDKRYFEDPNMFKPDRWLVDASDPIAGQRLAEATKASQPFSFGPRACPGRALAFRENGLLLAKLVYAFEMEPVTDNSTVQTPLRGIEEGLVFNQKDTVGAHEEELLVRYRLRSGVSLD